MQATTTDIADDAEPTLTERIKSLPQELIDMIQDRVFTCAPGLRPVKETAVFAMASKGFVLPTRLLTTQQVRAPDTISLLIVSKATRAQFIRSYYSSVFVVSFGLLGIWFRNLNEAQKALILEVRITDREEWRRAGYPDLSWVRQLVYRTHPELIGKVKCVANDQVTEVK